MKPEDLGIAGFTPEPDVNHPAEIMRTAAVVGARVRDLTTAAEAVGRDNATLRSALDRSQAAGQRLSAENFYLKKALAELRVHRAVLFGVLVLAVLLWRL